MTLNPSARDLRLGVLIAALLVAAVILASAWSDWLAARKTAAALVLGEAVRVFPQGNVARHLDFLRHPVVRTGGEIFFPGPFIFERHQLVDVGLTVDDALVGDVDAAHFDRCLSRRRGGGRTLQARRAGRVPLLCAIFKLQHVIPLYRFFGGRPASGGRCGLRLPSVPPRRYRFPHSF